MIDTEKKMTEIDALSRLTEIMNDSPRTIKLGRRTFKVKPLRMGTEWLIAQEACKIAKNADTFSDIMKRFAENIPSVVRVICLMILNDKKKIEGKEYQDLHDYIMWETQKHEWMGVVMECLQMLDYKGLFTLCGAIDLFRTNLKKNHQP